MLAIETKGLGRVSMSMSMHARVMGNGTCKYNAIGNCTCNDNSISNCNDNGKARDVASREPSGEILQLFDLILRQ